MENKDSTLKRKIHSIKYLHKEIEEILYYQLNSISETLEQEEANTPKRSRRQETLKLRAKINQQYLYF